MACGEVNIKPGDQGMDEVVSLTPKLEWLRKCQFLHRHGVEINREYRAWVGDECLHFHSVDQWFGQGTLLHRTVVEAVDIVPD